MNTNIFSKYQFPPLNLLIQLKNVDGYYKKIFVSIFLKITNFFGFFFLFLSICFIKYMSLCSPCITGFSCITFLFQKLFQRLLY